MMAAGQGGMMNLAMQQQQQQMQIMQQQQIMNMQMHNQMFVAEEMALM
jgi:hypothetical protein